MLDNNLKLKMLEKLLLQYDIYRSLNEDIKQSKFNLLKTEDKESKEKLKKQMEIKEIILNRTSDEMSFPMPSLWIMYKFNAYKNTDKDIHTCKDFLDHCSPLGYVCTERYKFLSKYINIPKLVDLNNEIISLCETEEFKKLENNSIFIESWILNEFKITNNKISKWK